MKILLCESGVKWSVTDVEAGLFYGLEAQGADVQRVGPDAQTWPMADAAIIVTAIRYTRAQVAEMVRTVPIVTALFTESPYESALEVNVARQMTGCWTHERRVLPALRSVNARAAYLPHAYHPDIHRCGDQDADLQVPAHDVVFVGSGFRERITFLNSIDWTGIDLGLYGVWSGFGLSSALEACVRCDHAIPNARAAALYRRARIGLNLYRRYSGLMKEEPPAESMNPRAYELAACGAFQLSEYRAEAEEFFGDMIGLFKTPKEAAYSIRSWLGRPTDRFDASARALLRVAGESWVQRAGQVLADLHAWSQVEQRAS